MKKILYIVLDGLGDLPNSELKNKTPLEDADTPNMDFLADRGKTGLVYPVGKGIAPESDIAVISILGYDAKKYYTGRGPLESFAVGLDVKNGSLAYRVNFATVDDNMRIIDRRVGRNLTTEEANVLCKEINEKVKLTSVPARFKFKNTVGHRGVLVIEAVNGKLSADVENTDPAYAKEGVFGVAKLKFESVVMRCIPVKGFENSNEAQNSALLTNEFVEKSHKVLNESAVNKNRKNKGLLPANVILTRDGGDRLPSFEKFSEKYNINFACFAEMPVEKGIAMLTGMDIVELSGLDDYPYLVKKVFENIERYDGLYIHIKGPDLPGHDGDVLEKKRIIEDIDKHFFRDILKNIKLDDVLIVVTADHSTPASLKSHSSDPVPFLISGGGIEKDSVNSFSEASCKNGSIGIINGVNIMPFIMGVRS